ncbi:relaxase/mobilization protein, partial [Thauera sp. 28]
MPQPRDRRAADSVTGQLLAEARERKTEGKAAHLAEFAQIKRELDARRLLAHLSKTHGVIPEKYEVTKGRDGSDR